MVIYGVAILALCAVTGAVLGDLLGFAIGAKANVGGVGIAMMLLVAIRWWLARRGWLPQTTTLGVEFWSLMYIPIVVAMAAQQNVVAALRGGPLVIIAGVLAVAAGFCLVPVLAGRNRALEAQEP